MLASKRYKDDLEKQKAERANMKNSLKPKALVDELETIKRRKQDTERIVEELRKSSDTELLKADERQDDVVRSKTAAFLKAAMQKENVLEDLTISKSKIEMHVKTMAC